MRQFYNPDLTPEQVDGLDRQNWLALQTVQAFLGLISDNFVAIAVEENGYNPGVVHIALGRESRADAEAVEEALVELDVFLGGGVAVEGRVIQSIQCPPEWKRPPLRLIHMKPV